MGLTLVQNVSSDCPISPSFRHYSESVEQMAATKIQAGFRGYRIRKQQKFLNNSYQTNLIDKLDQTKLENCKFCDQNNHNNAATQIQAYFRGYKTRKALKSGPIRNYVQLKKTNKHNTFGSVYSTMNGAYPLLTYSIFDSNYNLQNEHNRNLIKNVQSNQNEIYHNLNRHDPNLAAVKIQATYRGFKTRENLRHKYKSKIVPIYDDPNLAAIRIQAIYRGYRTRRYLLNH